MPRSARPDNSNTAAVIGTILVLAVLHLARDVLIPIATALLLTFVLAPVTRKLQRWGLGRAPSAALVVLVLVASVAWMGWSLGGQLFDLAGNLPLYKQNIRAKVAGMRQGSGGVIAKVGAGVTEMQELLEADKTSPSAPVKVTLVTPPPSVLETARTVLGPLLGPLMDTGIVIVFLLFMLVQREDLRDRLIRLIGQGRLSVTTQALDDAAKRVSAYLMAQVGINMSFGLCIALGLYFIGVPNAFLFGLMAAVLRFVPFLGPWIALLMPLAVSIAVSPGWSQPLRVVGLFAVIELLTNNIAEPLLYGHGTGLSTLAVVVSAVFWTWMWGTVGLILATPLTVCLLVISRYVPQLEFLGVLLGDEAPLAPAANYYQRLLAQDQVEAAEVIEDFLKEHSLVETYDAVVVPALALAEQDRHHGGLTEDREEFIVHSVNDLVDDLAERQTAPESLRTGRVVCLPARDAADAAAAKMVAQLIEAHGATATAVSPELLSGEMLELIAREKADAIVISAIPPYAVMYANYLCKRLRRRFPDLPVVVGLWGVTNASSSGFKRLSSVCGDRVVTTVGQALAQVLTLLPEPGALSSEEALPADEDDRLRDLTAVALLDTDPEPAFDHIVEGIAKSLAFPMAWIALVDGKREWWKAHVGLPAELAKVRSVERAGSLAARVVTAHELVAIGDVRRDPRAAASVVVRTSGARSFAGVPLISDTGRAIGALCVADTRPRTFAQAEREMLALVGQHVMAQVQLRAALARATSCEEQQGARSAEVVLETARELQHRLLPSAAVSSGGCRVEHVHRDAADGVTGYLDAVVCADGSIMLVVADTVAEPAKTLVVAATLKTSFARVASEAAGPVELLRALEEDLSRVAEKGDLVNITALRISPEGRAVEIACAGHGAPLKVDAHDATPADVTRGEPLLAPSRKSVPAVTLTLGAGERLLIAGDGAIEVEGADGKLLGARGLVQIVEQHLALPGDELLRQIASELDERTGEHRRADLVMALVEFPGT